MNHLMNHLINELVNQSVNQSVGISYCVQSDTISISHFFIHFVSQPSRQSIIQSINLWSVNIQVSAYLSSNYSNCYSSANYGAVKELDNAGTEHYPQKFSTSLRGSSCPDTGTGKS